MNQDELLERLWVEVIDAVDAVGAIEGAAAVDPLDARHVARQARYGALFEWCVAYDESGHRVSWWLSRPETHACWSELARWTPEAASREPVLRPKAPFADADAAWVRLLRQRVSGVALADFLNAQGRWALEGLRRLLAEQKWRAGELRGLHEGLLSADPSGLEAGPGSWPARRSRAPKPKSGPSPLRTLKRSFAFAFSPDGSNIVAATGGAITEIATGKVLARCQLLAHTGQIAWSPDGAWIAATSTSGETALCAAETGERVSVLSQAGEGAAPRFGRNGSLYGASWDGEISRWEIPSGRRIAVGDFPSSMVTVLEIATDGRVALLASRLPEHDPVELIFLDEGLQARLSAVPLPIWTQDVALDPKGPRALVTGQKMAGWLDLETAALSQRFESDDILESGAISGDGRWVVLTSMIGGRFRVSPAAALTRGVSRALQYANGRAIFSADSTRVALATWKAGEVWETDALVASCAAAPPERQSPPG